MDRRRIIIVGAGAAGLSAARQLRQVGYPITQLEAQARTGGRVKRQYFAGLNLDSGATFIHDKQLRLYAEARSRELLARTGQVGLIVNRRYMPAWRFALFHTLPNLRKSNRLFSTFYHNQDPQQTLDDLITHQSFDPVTAGLLHQVLASTLGAPLNHVAAKPLRDSFQAVGMRPERDLINQPLRTPLADLLAELYRSQVERVLTEHEVVSIDYSQTEIKVRCTNGRQFQTDKLILTVSLGVLKNRSIRFIPPLPQSHRTAIERLGMGQGGKIFLSFARRFWKPGLRQLINADQPCHFWMPYIRHPVVSAFYVGEPPGIDQLVDTLTHAFGCKARDLLQAHQHEDWSASPHIGGLYSYDALGSEGARRQLQQPVANRLFFAGEASIEGHFATVDGAIESGIRAASQVLQSV